MTFIDGEVYFERRDAFKVDAKSMAQTVVQSRPFDPDANVLPRKSSSYLIVGATVHPVSGPDLPNSNILIKDGRVEAVGDGARAGAGTVTIDGKGLHVYPGFIDAGSKLGIDEIGEVPSSQDSSENGDYKPDLRVFNSINPDNLNLPKARYNGITSSLTMPAGGVVAGQSALIDTSGFTTEQMAVQSLAALDVFVPAGPNGFFRMFLPQDQIKSMEDGLSARLATLTEFFEAGKRYGEAKSAGEEIRTDIKLDALQPYLKGDKPVIFHADDAAAIRQAVDLAKKFSLKAIIAGGAEAWQVTEVLKAANIPVIYKGPSDACPDEIAPPGDFDPYDAPYATPAVLRQAGVKFCFMSDSFDMAMNLPYNAGRTCAFGLSHDAAIRALTLDAATILGVGDRLGSLEKGKTANIIVTDGDPLELNSKLRYLFIEGKPVPLEDRYTALYRKYSGRTQGETSKR
jgi:imidazolonepropionase-like amidohydrolase